MGARTALVQIPINAPISVYNLKQLYAEFLTENYYIAASSMSSSNFLLIIDQVGLRGFPQGLHMRKSKETHVYLHTMPSNPCQEYFPVPVLSCARSIRGKSKLNHTYQNCSNLSHSLIEGMINSQLLPQSSSKSINIHHRPDCPRGHTRNPHTEGRVGLPDSA